MFGVLEKQYPAESGDKALHLTNIEKAMKIALRKLNRSVLNGEEEKID